MLETTLSLQNEHKVGSTSIIVSVKTERYTSYYTCIMKVRFIVGRIQ